MKRTIIEMADIFPIFVKDELDEHVGHEMTRTGHTWPKAEFTSG